MIIYTAAKITAGLLASLIVIGAVYQNIETYRDATKYPPIGTMVNIGTHKMHMIVSGNKTSVQQPTVILDAGLGCFALDWICVQQGIAQFAKVMSYDRSGYGWSEASSTSRTSECIIKELHDLLHNGNIEGPYILVGHSLGGINVQLYAKTYPDEVAGIVLVDSAHEDHEKDMPQQMRDATTNINRMAWLLDNCLAPLGAFRLLQQQIGFAKIKEMAIKYGYPTDMLDMLIANKCTTKYVHTICQESNHSATSLNQLKQSNPQFGDTPLVVIGASNSVMSNQLKETGVYNDETLTQLTQMHDRHLADMASRSTNSKLIVAENSGHLIPLEQPDIIVDAVREMIAA